MRYLVISDIHANLEALEAVLEDAQGQYTEVWCLGDLVGYGPDPNECVERVRELPVACVAGNHDWAALGKLPLDDFNPDARVASRWTQVALDASSRTYLEALPETLVIGDKVTLVHGSPRHPIWEYVISIPIALENFAYFETPWCLIGHSHIPVIFRYIVEDEHKDCEAIIPPFNQPISLPPGERFIINPGSVGQPRDGDPRASYMLIDPDEGTIEYRRVSYPVDKTQAKMEELGLPPRLIARLSFGW